MVAENFRENVTLQGILTRGEMDGPEKDGSFILWTYDEQEYRVTFQDPHVAPTLAENLPTKVEFQGIQGLDRKGRKTVAVKQYKLIR
ncbi:MAG: hypothetical protein P8Z70_00520 [Desulfuromonadales bacterium]